MFTVLNARLLNNPPAALITDDAVVACSFGVRCTASDAGRGEAAKLGLGEAVQLIAAGMAIASFVDVRSYAFSESTLLCPLTLQIFLSSIPAAFMLDMDVARTQWFVY